MLNGALTVSPSVLMSIEVNPLSQDYGEGLEGIAVAHGFTFPVVIVRKEGALAPYYLIENYLKRVSGAEESLILSIVRAKAPAGIIE